MSWRKSVVWNGWARFRGRAMECSARRMALATAAVVVLIGGCTQEMYDQPRKEYLEASRFFPDGMAARRPVEHTVARGELWEEHAFFTGQQAGGEPVEQIPSDPRTGAAFQVTRAVLQRGRERFDAFCSHCHGRVGYGQGMVVRRGFRQPPSLHETRLREETPPGEYFRVITEGFRTMPAQGDRIAPADRWAIVAYLRVLQRSQHVKLTEAPADIRNKFDRHDKQEDAK